MSIICERSICLLIAGVIISTQAGPTSTESNPEPIKCGERLTKPLQPSKILIDTGSEIEQWPWVGALYIRFDDNPPEFRCVVTILNDRFVLTAGYCVSIRRYNVLPSDLSVRLGTANLVQESLQKVYVKEVLISNTTDRFTTIALLKLSSKIEFNLYVHPVCLPDVSNEEEILGRNGYVVGWQSSRNSVIEKCMRESSVSMVRNSNCPVSERLGLVMKGKICAKKTTPSTKDISYYHDVSGLYIEDDGKWYVRGVAPIAVQEQFWIFSEIIPLLPWIRDTID